MISIVSPVDSPRLHYAVELLLGIILDIPYEIIKAEEVQTDQFCVFYGESPDKTMAAIPSNTPLLHAGYMEKAMPPIEQRDLPYIFFQAEQQAHIFPFDLFAATFYLATEYAKQIDPVYDAYGRYAEGEFREKAFKLDQSPLLHDYAYLFRDFLLRHYPALERYQLPSYDYELTMDVDQPWKFLHKPWWIRIGGMANDIVERDWGNLQERMITYRNGDDPFDIFVELGVFLPAEKSRLFFLIERHAKEDSRFSWRHPELRALIQHLQGKGYPIGIHPSFTSYLSAAKIHVETQHLREIAGEVQHSRQHFLKYRYPNTFRSLLAAGIRHEYSLCQYTTGGFPCGMARPFPWYDLEQETITDLWLHPTILMDRSLQQYASMTPEEALARGKQLVERTREIGGLFTFLIHNDALSESGEWKGWRACWRELLAEIQRE